MIWLLGAIFGRLSRSKREKALTDRIVWLTYDVARWRKRALKAEGELAKREERRWS